MKKHYLRRKFALLFAGVFFALIVIMLIGDNFFLERFYENRKEHVLQNAYLEIDHALPPFFRKREKRIKRKMRLRVSSPTLRKKKIFP